MAKRKWTKQSLMEAAKHFKGRREFSRNCGGAYGAALKLGCLDEVCAHMPDRIVAKRKPYKWTESAIRKEAKKYQTKAEFIRGSRQAYAAARNRNILRSVCSHMRPRFRWTLPLIKKEAKKYKTRKQFSLGCQSAYQTARRLGILDEVCAHMKYVRKYAVA